MPMKKIVLIFTATIFTILACNNQKAQDQSNTRVDELDSSTEKSIDIRDEEYIIRAKEFAQSTGSTLMGELSKAMGEGGVINAVEYCSLNALSLTDSMSKTLNVQISRISHKNRNPNNNASTKELEMISQYISKKEEGIELKPRSVTSEDAYTVYIPIEVKGLCLNCHGEVGKDIADEDYIVISNLYPDDRATGFQLGDLRGLWKISFPVEKS